MLTSQEVTRLVEEYSDCIYRVSFARVKNVAYAQDIVQEVFLKLITSKPVFENEEHCKAWLIRVAINTTISLLRSPWMRKITLEEKEIRGEMIEECSLYDKILRLSAKERIVIHLYYYEEYSIDDIANILEVKPTTVKTRLHRARKHLKIFLEE